MKKLIVDIETNAITDWENLSDLHTIHCIVLMDCETEKLYSYNSQTEGAIERAIDLIAAADSIVGHNAIGFDWPALVHWTKSKGMDPGQLALDPPYVADTKVMAACVHPDLKAEDFLRDDFPRNLVGSHSLKAWGIRLGILKGDHGATEDWAEWSPEMEEYCKQDVRVTYALYRHLLSKHPSQMMLLVEHSFAKAIRTQVENGFPFNYDKASLLAAALMKRRVELESELQELFSPTVTLTKTPIWKTPDGATWKTKKSAVAGGWKPADVERGPNRTKSVPFNPGSRDQIAERLMSAGWKPAAYEGKRPEINEVVLRGIGTPASEKLLEYLLVQKRLGALAEGKNAWMNMERKGRIHGNVNTNGTYSGRCSHFRPNLAQVPASRAPYGGECRELFSAPEDRVLVGADASGIELRVLAHYLSQWDNGAYAKAIIEGDIHTANQEAAGLSTRDEAKKFIYMWLYGAGNKALGDIVDGGEREGKALKEQFLRKIPGVGNLLRSVESKVTSSGVLTGLDGRLLPARKTFSALNLLCQSAAAVVMKQALIEFTDSALALQGSSDGPLYEMHANVHDEVQFSCKPEHAEELGQLFVDSIKNAGKVLKVRCPLDGEYKVGANWKETH
jgi:DNA polymerase-1